jgi:hypothetical protein
MVTVTLIDAAATRATELAHARGVSEDAIVAELVLQAPFPDHSTDTGLAALEAFFGCGTSTGPQLSVKEMRRDLAARKLAAGIENL